MTEKMNYGRKWCEQGKRRVLSDEANGILSIIAYLTIFVNRGIILS